MGILFSREKENPLQDTGKFSSPCMGILFSQVNDFWGLKDMVWSFSSPCMGILFSPSRWGLSLIRLSQRRFRPHVWGFFFHMMLFIPRSAVKKCFRPHVWGFFFHLGTLNVPSPSPNWFSSPCMGILFSLERKS